MHKMVVSPRCLALAALFALGACAEFPAGPGDDEPVTLVVSVAQDTLVLDTWGDTASAAVSVKDEAGNAVTGASLAWESLDTTVVVVSSTGVVRSVRAGEATVRVTATKAGATAGQAELTARVLVQRNSQCVAPGTPDRGAYGGVPAYGAALIQDQLPAPAWPGSRALGLDWDGDGDDDIVRLEYSYPSHTPYSGETRVFLNRSGAEGWSFVDATATRLGGAVVPDHPRDFEIGDFTGDGVPDAYVAQHGFDAEPYPGAPNLLLTRSDSLLVEVSAERFSPYSTNSFSHGSAAADFDCDGDLDLAELNLNPGVRNRLWLNGGTGTFTLAAAGALPIDGSSGQRWQEVAAIDFDGDGDTDLFLGARSGSGWNEDAMLVNDGFGRFYTTTAVRLPAPRYSPNHAINNSKAADFDGDGDQDLILFEIPQPFSTTSAVRLWLNGGDGSFTDASAGWGLPAACGDEIIEPLRVVDLNHDEWPDVLVPYGCPELGGAGALFNTGTAFVSVPFTSLEPWLEYDSATPIDADGDGRLDLFFGERGGEPALVLHP